MTGQGCQPWCAEDQGHDGGCHSRSRMQRAAVLRLMRVCGREVERHSVAYWDQRTSGNDARAALSIACGAPPNDVDPVLGTWNRPTEQLTLEVAA